MAKKAKNTDEEKKDEINDNESVVNEKSSDDEIKEDVNNKQTEATHREVATPVVVASYRVPERKNNNYFLLYITIACILLFISTIVLSVSQYKTRKKVSNIYQKNIELENSYLQLSEDYNELMETANVYQKKVDELEGNYLQISGTYNNLME